MGVFWDYGTTYLHQNGQNTVHTSPTKLRGHLQTILEKITSSRRFGGELCLTFCDRQTTLFGTLLYDTFCVENCMTFFPK